MIYNRLGRAGVKVSELSFGSWLTFGTNLDVQSAKECMVAAFEAGVNFFDNAEGYGKGRSEEVMGEALKVFKRQDLVISTKIFFGGDGPNQGGLSFKHLVEGTTAALKRMQLEYVDLLFCHRPDPNTTIEETVRAMDCIIKRGYAFYWGTSEWSAAQIKEAYEVAYQLNCIPPTMEQPQYNLFVRGRLEREYAELYETYGLGTTIWSPLASGILSGKYNSGIPKGSRLDQQAWLRERLTEAKIEKAKALEIIAKDLSCSLAQLSIAWCLQNPRVSTVILGATNTSQLKENLGALSIKGKLTPEVMARIEDTMAGFPVA